MYIEMDGGLYAMNDVNYIDYMKSDNCLVVILTNDSKNPSTVMLQDKEADNIWKIFGEDSRFCVCGEKLFNMHNIYSVGENPYHIKFTDGCSLKISKEEYNKIVVAKEKYDKNQEREY